MIRCAARTAQALWRMARGTQRKQPTCLQVKTKVQNVSTAYKAYKDKISHSGEENVWAKYSKPFWWDAAEELWATRAATQPDVVLEVGNGVKVEGRKGTEVLRAPDAPEELADDLELEGAGAAADGEGGGGAAAAADAEVARREEARNIRQKRKSSAKEQAAKEQVNCAVEAGRRINEDLMSHLAPLVKDITAAVKDLPGALALALGGGHKKKKHKRSQLSSERSSPSSS